MMDASLYQPLFLTVTGVLAVLLAGRLYMSPDAQLTIKGQPNNFWIALPICFLLALWLGFRPPYAVQFVDSFSYAHSYENVEFGFSRFDVHGEWLFTNLTVACRELGLSVHGFFTIVAMVYVLSALWAMTILVPKNPLLGIVFVFGSLMFFTFGVNGIRNGMACHLTLLCIAFLLQSDYMSAAVVAAAAFFIHRSTALPIASVVASRWLVKKPEYGMYIWLGAIAFSLLAGNWFMNIFASAGFDNRMESYTSSDASQFGFSSTGFRWDFLIYSAMPILLGYYVLIVRGMKENWYRVLFNTYCIANAFWVLVIRAAFSNRFAYLSWFLYPAVIVYPLIMMRVWDDQDRKTAQILLAYVGFTIIMNTLYW
ncbi:MAG: EpsG family protein [Muribaculaceae bacterium]|nr:EpsG family protein [Muribaculaceae bacterium]